MNKREALIAMAKGEKVKVSEWSPGSYIFQDFKTGRIICDEGEESTFEYTNEDTVFEIYKEECQVCKNVKTTDDCKIINGIPLPHINMHVKCMACDRVIPKAPPPKKKVKYAAALLRPMGNFDVIIRSQELFKSEEDAVHMDSLYYTYLGMDWDNAVEVEE